jgi:hypothetical protein
MLENITGENKSYKIYHENILTASAIASNSNMITVLFGFTGHQHRLSHIAPKQER